MIGPKPTAGPCEVCNGPVSTFIAYNHENGAQTERILREDWKASVDAHHEYEASLRAEVERLRPVVEELVRFGDLSDKCRARGDWSEWPDPLDADADYLTWSDRMILRARSALAALAKKETKPSVGNPPRERPGATEGGLSMGEGEGPFSELPANCSVQEGDRFVMIRREFPVWAVHIHVSAGPTRAEEVRYFLRFARARRFANLRWGVE